VSNEAFRFERNLRRLACGRPRRPIKVAAIVLANKIARVAWAMMTKGELYKEPVALKRLSSAITRLPVQHFPICHSLSPDLNPIEMPFSTFKGLLAQARAARKSLFPLVPQGTGMRQLSQACRLCFIGDGGLDHDVTPLEGLKPLLMAHCVGQIILLVSK